MTLSEKVVAQDAAVHEAHQGSPRVERRKAAAVNEHHHPPVRRSAQFIANGAVRNPPRFGVRGEIGQRQNGEKNEYAKHPRMYALRMRFGFL